MKSTTDLLSALKNSKNIDEYISDNNDSLMEGIMPVSELLENLLKEKQLKKSDVIKKAEMNEIYAYEIFRGKKAKPDRNKLLSLLIAMDLNFDEIQSTLKAAGYHFLYAKNKRDSIIIMCIEKKMSVMDTNNELFRQNEPTFSEEG